MNVFNAILKDRSLKPMLSFVLFVLVLVLLYLVYGRIREGMRLFGFGKKPKQPKKVVTSKDIQMVPGSVGTYGYVDPKHRYIKRQYVGNPNTNMGMPGQQIPFGGDRFGFNLSPNMGKLSNISNVRPDINPNQMSGLSTTRLGGTTVDTYGFINRNNIISKPPPPLRNFPNNDPMYFLKPPQGQGLVIKRKEMPPISDTSSNPTMYF